MKYATIRNMVLLSCTFALSCKPSSVPCNECNDKAIVKIDPNDKTAPTFQWTVSDVKAAGGQTSVSSEIIKTGGTASRSIGPDVSYNLNLIAVDNESGIKSLRVEGKYTFSCYAKNGVNIDRGDIKLQSKEFSFDNCALRSWEMVDERINYYATCGENEFLNSDLTFIARSINFAGKSDSSVITVHFNPQGK